MKKTSISLVLALALAGTTPACATVGALKDLARENEQVQEAIAEDIERAVDVAAGVTGLGPWADAISAALISALSLNSLRNRSRKKTVDHLSGLLMPSGQPEAKNGTE